MPSTRCLFSRRRQPSRRCVDGKLVGTIGVFISLSGYSDDAVDALVAGKVLNVILFDRPDWEKSIDPSFGFREVLLQKLRFAAEQGSPFLSASKLSSRRKLLIVTEGNLDQVLLRIVLEKVERNLLNRIHFIAAGGALNAANVAKFAIESGIAERVLIVLDRDPAGVAGAERIPPELLDRVGVVFADPFLDHAVINVLVDRFGSYERYREHSYRERTRIIEEVLRDADPSDLLTNRVIADIVRRLRSG